MRFVNRLSWLLLICLVLSGYLMFQGFAACAVLSILSLLGLCATEAYRQANSPLMLRRLMRND